jgi:hypothetical protein
LYGCPIRHAWRIRVADSRYPAFFDRGDAGLAGRGSRESQSRGDRARTIGTADAMRHATITDLIALHKLDTPTVAQLSGARLLLIWVMAASD